MPDDRRPGKGRSLKALPVVLGAATAKSMKVRMKTTMAGPGGIRHPEEVVDLPEAEANALIEADAAVLVPSASTPGEGGATPDKDPFTDEKGRFGIDLDPFLEWLTPDDYREAGENHKPIIFLGDPRDAKDERRAAANRRLRERLSEALKSTYELRYLSLDNPDADWELVKPHRYPEIVKQVSYRLFGIRKTFKLEGCDRPVPVRVFRRDPTVMRDERQVIRDEKNAKVCTEFLKVKIRDWEADGKPRDHPSKPHYLNEFEQLLEKKGLSTVNSDRVFNETWTIEVPKEWKERGRKGRRSDR